MAEVTVRWTQKVMGREPGQEETVEHTPLIDALLANNRLEILAADVAVSPHENDLGQVLEYLHMEHPLDEDTITKEVILPEAVSEVEFEIPKPRPPRRPGRVNDEE